MKEDGIFTGASESSYKSKHDIVLEHIEKREPLFHTSYKDEDKNFEFWQTEMQRRQELRNEVDPVRNFASIEIPCDRPVAIAFLGDLHLGGANVDYELLGEDIMAISEHPLVYTFLMGDLTDSFFWNDAKDGEVFNSNEQWSYIRSVLDKIGSEKILGAWRGNHDFHWAKKTGMTGYDRMNKEWDCPIFDGTTHIDLRVGDIDYTIVGAHELPGSSIYNNAHPGARGHKENQGYDVAIGAHTHRKGVLSQAMRDSKGGRKTIAAVTGTYKEIDGYGRRKGMGAIPKAQRGCLYMVFNHDKKMIRVADNTQEMIETMKYYLQD
jgi:hypothetical protein